MNKLSLSTLEVDCMINHLILSVVTSSETDNFVPLTKLRGSKCTPVSFISTNRFNVNNE